MMRATLIAALGISLCMCGQPGLETMQQAQNGEKEWTLLFYFSADSGNEGGAIRDINALERGIDSTDYNIVVQIDRIPGNDSSNGDWTDCRRFLIEPDPDPDNVIRSTELESIGEVNMGDPQTVADFVDWGVENYPAERYAVMIWGGAMPNGIAADFSESSPDPIRTIYGGLTEAYALATTAIGRRLDLCVLWGCNYGMFENDFVIKEYCDVTARSEIPTNYMLSAATAIPTWLNANPAASAREFGAAWVDGYIDTAVLMGAWASIDLGPGYVDLALAVDIFARELIKAGGITQGDIAAAMGNTVRCYAAEFDLNHFAKNIANTPALPQSLKDAAQSVIDAYGYPPQAGMPLVNFRFVDGSITGNETWPTGDTAELRGTKIRQTPYQDGGYLPFAANNAWHWFLAGETALPAEPLVTYQSNTLSNSIESGSPTPLGLTLRNSGGLTATGITGLLSTTDSAVVVTQDTSAFSDIISEATGTSQTDFSVTVDAAAPIGHRVWFWLDLTANNGAYVNSTTFCLEVTGCTDGANRPCYDGPPATQNVGLCRSGMQFCTTGTWGACENQVLPVAEDCADTMDNDCDGDIDLADSDCAQCAVDAHCDDGVFCNGVETCVNGICLPGSDPCPAQICDEDLDQCVPCTSDEMCDDGLYCNGEEYCDAQNGCSAGTAVDCDDSVGCTTDSCNETDDRCDHVEDDLACDDGLYCNGAEYCDAVDDCQSGPAPDCDDDNVCTDDICDQQNGCRHSFNTAPCDDGDDCTVDDVCSNAACRGTIPDEVCDDGVDNDCDGDTDAQDTDCGGGDDPRPSGGCSCGGNGGNPAGWALFGLLLFAIIRRASNHY
jgi:uncharacterized protein (TIGR03382 family)